MHILLLFFRIMNDLHLKPSTHGLEYWLVQKKPAKILPVCTAACSAEAGCTGMLKNQHPISTGSQWLRALTGVGVVILSEHNGSVERSLY